MTSFQADNKGVKLFAARVKKEYLSDEKAHKTPFLFIVSPQTIRVFAQSTSLQRQIARYPRVPCSIPLRFITAADRALPARTMHTFV
jgi:hypothetical protein